MTSNTPWSQIVQQVHHRAKFQCEYCQTQQKVMGQAMHVEHINPDGGDLLDNLALSCASCNLSKARATTALDPETNELVALFNPRTQVWLEHFEWIENATIVHGLTPIGRATVERLKINIARMVIARKVWVRAGEHPPE